MYKKKILIVDDDASIVEALQILLEDNGYEVESAKDGKKLLKEKDCSYDLILLDIWMPGLDGGKICKRLKNQKQTKDISVVLISANNDTERVAKEVGADNFIDKPFEIDELLATIEKTLKKKNK